MSVPLSFKAAVDGSDLLVSVIARADDGREEVDSARAIFVGLRPLPPVEEVSVELPVVE
jgi:hypothetical protein